MNTREFLEQAITGIDSALLAEKHLAFDAGWDAAILWSSPGNQDKMNGRYSESWKKFMEKEKSK
jgi:hypothetical protein